MKEPIILNFKYTASMSEMHHDLKNIMDKLPEMRELVIMDHGTPAGILMSVEEYNLRIKRSRKPRRIN